MAHGDKKWIVAYDGKIKRSNDRTKKDYYRELKWWEPSEGKYRFSRWEKKAKFCPQCKHVRKHIETENRNRYDWYSQLRKEYDAQYGEADKQWEEYRRGKLVYSEYLGTYIDIAQRPKIAEPPRYYQWLNAKEPFFWSYHWRSYLCWKCERKQEVKYELWNGRQPGQNANYQYVRTQEYRNYRNEVKNILNRAKYDEDYYEEIPAHKKGWLD